MDSVVNQLFVQHRNLLCFCQGRKHKKQIDPSLADATILDTSVTWKDFCTEINKIVVGNGARMTSAEDKRLGAYFVHLRDLKFDERMGDPIFDCICKRLYASPVLRAL